MLYEQTHIHQLFTLRCEIKSKGMIVDINQVPWDRILFLGYCQCNQTSMKMLWPKFLHISKYQHGFLNWWANFAWKEIFEVKFVPSMCWVTIVTIGYSWFLHVKCFFFIACRQIELIVSDYDTKWSFGRLFVVLFSMSVQDTNLFDWFVSSKCNHNFLQSFVSCQLTLFPDCPCRIGSEACHSMLAISGNSIMFAYGYYEFFWRGEKSAI